MSATRRQLVNHQSDSLFFRGLTMERNAKITRPKRRAVASKCLFRLRIKDGAKANPPPRDPSPAQRRCGLHHLTWTGTGRRINTCVCSQIKWQPLESRPRERPLPPVQPLCSQEPLNRGKIAALTARHPRQSRGRGRRRACYDPQGLAGAQLEALC